VSDAPAFAVLAFVFFVFFAWGLLTGDMPLAPSSVKRVESPILFWTASAFNLVMAVVSAAVAIHSGLSNT
jgi:hypothetical protein